MIFRPLLWCLLAILVTSCKNTSAKNLLVNNQLIEYELDKETYAIVVVREEGMSAEEAKKKAMEKAAEKTQEGHRRYFTVESEGEVQAVSATGSAYDGSHPPRNMYYELIQSDNFGRDRFEDERTPQEGVYPAYRIIFKCYLNRPSSEAVDSCDIISCKSGG